MCPLASSETAPVRALAPQDLDTLLHERRAYHAIDRPLLPRREPREGSAPDRHGVWRERLRPSSAPMGLARAGAHRQTGRARQPLRREGAWDDDMLLRRHGPEGAHALGDDNGVLTLAGSDGPTQGPESGGVKRRDGGELGPRASGRASVGLGSTRPHGSTRLARRRYLPQAGGEDAGDAARRQAGGVPADRAFTTTPMWGWTMIPAVHPAGRRRGRGVACDAAVGRATTRVDPMAGRHWWADAEGAHDPRVWQARPATSGPVWSGRGRTPTRAQVVRHAAAPPSVALLASAVPARAWAQPVVKEGSQGPIVAEFAPRRGMAGRDGLPGPAGGLSRRRHGLPGALQPYRRPAPADIPPVTVVRMSGMRWPLDTCVADGTPRLGLGDDAVRSWRGGHQPRTWWVLEYVCLGRRQGR